MWFNTQNAKIFPQPKVDSMYNIDLRKRSMTCDVQGCSHHLMEQMSQHLEPLSKFTDANCLKNASDLVSHFAC